MSTATVRTPRFRRLLQDMLLEAADAAPEKPAFLGEDRAYSYSELLSAASSLAAVLQERGLRRGDRVAIYMENGWPAAVALFGTLLAGGVFLVVNPQTKPEKLAYILEDSGAKLLLTEGHLRRSFAPVLEGRGALSGVLCAGTLPSDAARVGSVEPFEPALESGLEPVEPGTIPVDLAALIYTSGSTGQPKGVMMSHQAMVFATGSLLEYLRLDAGHRILNVLPFAFDYGLYQLLMAVGAGATLVSERSFTYPAQVLKRIKEEEVTVFPGVPTIYSMLLSVHERSPLEFPSVTRVTNTAAALPPGFLPRLEEIFPNALIYKMYGLTECKRVAYLEPELLYERSASVGKAIPGTEVFLLSQDGRPTPPGEVGILHVRGPHVMLGYWNRPEKTSEMLKPGPLPGERILCTHDHFRMDADGFLYFVGRTDDIIKTRGEKVSPVEVENALLGIEGVREAAVVGIPDPTLGQALRAYVALDEGSSVTEKQIKKHCLAHLENFMVPQEVRFLAELPKTSTGKIRKKDLE